MSRDLRLARVREELARRGCAGAVLYASGRHQMLRFAPSNYLFDFLPLGNAVVLLPPGDEAPVLLVHPAWDEARAREAAGSAAAVRGVADWVAALAELVSGAPSPAAWALVGADRMPCGELERLYAAVPGVSWRRCDDLLDECAAVKDEDERAAVRRAAAIADAGFWALYEAVAPGVREYEVVAEMDYAMRRLGAEDNFGLVASGPSLQAIRVATERALAPGDVVIAEITPGYRGYFAQLCRTIVLGEPPAIMYEKYALLEASFEAGRGAARPGRPVAEVAAAVDAVFRAAGYGEYTRPPYMRVRGHGLGMGSGAPGNVSAQNDAVLQPGMTMIIHPNQFLPETGYLMLGDTVEITSDGAASLSQVERRLFQRAP